MTRWLLRCDRAGQADVAIRPDEVNVLIGVVAGIYRPVRRRVE